MITFFTKKLRTEEKGAGVQKLILYFAGIMLVGFILMNLLVGSPINFYATDTGLLSNNLLIRDLDTKSFSGVSDDENNQFLMFQLEYQPWSKQFLDFGADVIVNAMGGR